MKSVFLESHNIKNLYFGFGQFNYHLIKGIHQVCQEKPDELNFHLMVKNNELLKKEFGDFFTYKKYYSFYRKPIFRVKKKYNLWHSLNQNTKIEPFYKQPYLLTIHDVNFVEEVSNNPNHPVQIRFKEKLKRATAITYISEFAKASTHQHFNVPNIPEFVIYNGNPIAALNIESDFQAAIVPNSPFLFSIGEFTERKNFNSLIKMLAHLPKDINLVLAGNNTTNYTKTIEETIKKLQLKNRVYIVGKISDKEKQYYLQNCIGFVFPSLREGFGIPVIEAMHYGKPVFISNNTSLPEIGGKHAFYWDHYDPEYMASVLNTGLDEFNNNPLFLTDWYKKRALSFNWKKSAEEYIKVYNSLI